MQEQPEWTGEKGDDPFGDGEENVGGNEESGGGEEQVRRGEGQVVKSDGEDILDKFWGQGDLIMALGLIIDDERWLNEGGRLREWCFN